MDDVEMSQMSRNQGYGNTGYASQPQSKSRDILDACEEVDGGIDTLSGLMDRLQGAQRRAIADMSSSGTSSNSEVDGLNAEIMTQYKSMLNRMKWIKSRPGAGDDMNSMQVGKVDRKLRDTYKRFQTMEYEYKKKMRDGIERQYRITRPEATEQEVQEASDDPNQQVFMNALMRSDRRGESRAVLSNVRDRHEQIQKIERQMTELAKMFEEMEAIVVQQDPMITKVEQGAEETNEHVEQANLQLDTANKSARRTRRNKWICCGISGISIPQCQLIRGPLTRITVAILLVIIIIVVIVVLVLRNQSKVSPNST